MPTTTTIPDPVLQSVENLTRFPHFAFDKLGAAKQFYDVVVLKGTFDMNDGALTQAVHQVNPVLADDYWDEDAVEVSSLRLTGDVLLYKPSSDVFVTGTAKAYAGKPEKDWGGALRVLDINEKVLIQKTLRFTGPRWWKCGLLSGWTLTEPEPTTAVPIRYELAYGGYWLKSDEPNQDQVRQVYKPNPSGSGHFGKSHDTRQIYAGPQIEVLTKRINGSNREYTPAGFGPRARFWQPRLQYAGTYDAAWVNAFLESGMPWYPDDFDMRFFQAAPLDQITPNHLKGNEWIQLAGLFSDKRAFSVQLPQVEISATLQNAAGEHKQDSLKLDTIHVDIDDWKIYLTWRLTLPQSAGIQHVTLTASPSRK